MKKIKIARVVTIPIVFVHILHLLDTLAQDDRFEVHIISDEGDFYSEMKERYPKFKFHNLKISREINIIKDFVSLLRLTRLYQKERYDIIHSHTPKAGLVSSLAGLLARAPIRLHTFTGQVWATKSGFLKFILKSIDQLIVLLNSHCYVDSPSQKDYLIENNIGTDKNLSVLLNGGFGGVNTSRFNKDKNRERIESIKQELFPHFSGKILIYLGRINIDKGISELYETFCNLKLKYDIKLLLAGPIDSGGIFEFESLMKKIRQNPDVVYVPFTSRPEIYLGVGDIFCFPSYREGFGTVALEASSMELPVVASNIYGISDAVLDKYSGLLFNPRDVTDFTNKISSLLSDPDYLLVLGKQGRKRAIESFSEELLTEAMLKEYRELIEGLN